ncbi:TraR/DksA C4-type zinc finger protein [Alkalicoccus daliensis]|uniref:Transcriptional regulator, TraR/DksA family n=1 Tax=Alkalicoccus daliensis TaxID=745820 RepID=A0A1H0AN38_9BACI|nr:TraR/DksA C4-type zinc finger protein [Alkalicoccus daliensis]SDN34761.1 transcriptional regulator, TraR/DksA family [Alkalicoccus daliensis]
MEQKKLDKFKKILESRKKELKTDSTVDPLDDEELSNYDNHPADQGTELADRHTEQALTNHQKNELFEIEESLRQIEKGTYGICQVSGEEIPEERLEVQPTAKTKVEYSDQLQENRRPVEEEVTSTMQSGQRDRLRQGHLNDAMDHGTSDSDQDK